MTQHWEEAGMSEADRLEARLEELHAYIARLEDRVDLACDEFKRIHSCPGADEEIRQLCERGQKDIHQHTPVIVQRDRAEARVSELEARVAQLNTSLAAERTVVDWIAEHVLRLYWSTELAVRWVGNSLDQYTYQNRGRLTPGDALRAAVAKAQRPLPTVDQMIGCMEEHEGEEQAQEAKRA